MRYFASLIALSEFFVSCSNSVSKEQVAKLNGYWQIDKVVTPKGEQKDYQSNTSYDYFEIKNDKGFRSKVMPQIDGSFLTNGLKEQISVSYEKNGTFLNYATAYAKWKEQITTLTDDELVVENNQKIEYHYKKAGPIKIE